jgi:hypothetical protein
MASLDSVRQKIFRAAAHCKSLEAELQRYFETNPGQMVRQPDTPANEAFFTFEAKGPIPARFGLIVGDCLQNLRSCFDYLVWELVGASNNIPTKDHQFPVCKSPEAFEDQVTNRKKLDGIDPDAIAQIKALQPYQLGEDWEKSILWTINELTNINKHRRVLLTTLRAGHNANMRVVDIDGELFTPGPMPTFDTDTKIGPFPIVSGQVQMDTQLFACVAFNEGPAKGMEITTCLNMWMLDTLQDVVPRFERFFS